MAALPKLWIVQIPRNHGEEDAVPNPFNPGPGTDDFFFDAEDDAIAYLVERMKSGADAARIVCVRGAGQTADAEV